MCLIYLSPVPWASFAQRPQKFVEWFHKRTGQQVHWVEPYPTRFPQLSDFGREVSAKSEAVAKHPSWLQIYSPRALPVEPLPGSGLLNGWLWSSLIRRLKVRAAEEDVVIVVGKPSVLALQILRVLKPKLSVYDAMDDFPAFYSGLSRRAMTYRESCLARRVSKVWVSSSALRERWSREVADVVFVPNALDGSLLTSTPRLTDSSERKIFGYVGTIGAWFDWDWVLALATMRSGDTIRLIGPIYCPAPFDLPKNIELQPPCRHAEALLAMREFDIGLIPFKKNELTSSVDPIKYYEYRALGLPVISTNFGEMQHRANAVGTFISRSLEDIAGISEVARAFKAPTEASAEFVKGNTWDVRFDAANLLA